MEHNISGSGGIVYWTIASHGIRRESLAWALNNGGMGERLPPPTTPFAALKAAANILYHGREGRKRRLVRPLAGEKGVCVTLEDPGTIKNDYEHGLSIIVDEAGSLSFEFPENTTSDEVDKVTTEFTTVFNRELHYVQAWQINAMLVKFVKDYKGVALRQTGGVYWLDADGKLAWSSISKAIAIASKDEAHKSSCYTITTQVDAEGMRALKDALESEVDKASTDLIEEVAAGKLGPDALTARAGRVQALADKVRHYESIVGEVLTSLHEAVRKAAGATTAAIMVAASDEGDNG